MPVKLSAGFVTRFPNLVALLVSLIEFRRSSTRSQFKHRN
jgi:hypothetical protein